LTIATLQDDFKLADITTAYNNILDKICCLVHGYSKACLPHENIAHMCHGTNIYHRKLLKA